MTEITPFSKGAAVETPAQRVPVPAEPHLPQGRQITTVQPHPTPIITAHDPGPVVAGDSAKQLHVAQARADITGTGTLVDIIV